METKRIMASLIERWEAREKALRARAEEIHGEAEWEDEEMFLLGQAWALQQVLIDIERNPVDE